MAPVRCTMQRRCELLEGKDCTCFFFFRGICCQLGDYILLATFYNLKKSINPWLTFDSASFGTFFPFRVASGDVFLWNMGRFPTIPENQYC